MGRKVRKRMMSSKQVQAGQPPEGKANVAYCPPPDEFSSPPKLKHLGGSKSDQWNLMLCNQVMGTAWYSRNAQPGKDLSRRTIGFRRRIARNMRIASSVHLGLAYFQFGGIAARVMRREPPLIQPQRRPFN
jgi:hypothetical protein